MDWSKRVKENVVLEIEYLRMLESEGMDQSVLPFLSLLSEMNNKPMYLDQEPEYEIDLDDDCTEETVH